MSTFRVDLDGLDLSEEQSQRLSSGLQRLVLEELAGLDFKGDAFAAIRDPKWRGIWVRQLHRPDLDLIDPGIFERIDQIEDGR